MCCSAKYNGIVCETQGELKKALNLETLPLIHFYTEASLKDCHCLCPIDFDALERYGYNAKPDDVFDMIIIKIKS
jgi:hypothetical protein